MTQDDRRHDEDLEDDTPFCQSCGSRVYLKHLGGCTAWTIPIEMACSSCGVPIRVMRVPDLPLCAGCSSDLEEG
jgi:hypothetical protein